MPDSTCWLYCTRDHPCIRVVGMSCRHGSGIWRCYYGKVKLYECAICGYAGTNESIMVGTYLESSVGGRDGTFYDSYSEHAHYVCIDKRACKRRSYENEIKQIDKRLLELEEQEAKMSVQKDKLKETQARLCEWLRAEVRDA